MRVTSTAAAGSPADGPTRKLHPISRPSSGHAPPAPSRAGQPLPQAAQQRRLPPTPPPAGRPPRPHPQARPAHGPHGPGQAGDWFLQPGQLPPPPSGQRPEPRSSGEQLLQCAYGTTDRARRFHRDQVLDHLNEAMIAFVGRMEMAFIGTADARGECDSSLRAGPPGFLHVLDGRRIAYPEYRGNGVLASLGNISENPHIGMLMIDFTQDLIGLHVNGRARIVEDADLRAEWPALPAEFDRGRTPERWVVVHVVQAYVHCRKHIPRMRPVPRDRDWGTDDAPRKGGDYFGARAGQGAPAR